MASNFNPVAFESTWKKKEEKEHLRKAREAHIEKAKAEFEHKEWKKEQARLRGEGTWMLSSVTDRINEENKEIEEALSKKDKKKKKHKKEKKQKSEKKNKSEEKDVEVKDYNVPRQRDDWMMAPADLFGGVTREQLRAEKNAEKEKEAQERSLLDRPGMHARELNPYWKDGGTGLPEEKKSSEPVPVVGDGGVAWLRKAYQRCKQQAEEEGRSLEELAAERYGSLAKLEEMIEEAEKAARPEPKRPAFRRPRSRSRERRSRSRDRRSRSSSREKRRRSRSRDRRDRSQSRDRRRSRSRSRDRKRSRSRSRDRRRSRSRERRSRSRSRDRRRSRSRSRDRQSSSTKKPGLKGMFMKPGELQRGASSSKSSSSGGWRKEMKKPDSSKVPSWEKEVKKKSPPAPVPSSSDSDSSSESEKEEDSRVESDKKRGQSPPPIVLLSEDEMNKLAAKVMRAQIMGNEALAKELQAKLDASREAKKNAPAEALAGPSAGKIKEVEEVVLTRTDRRGMTRPVFESTQPKEPKRGRRKPQKVATHEDGERTRYFDDDDKYSLKDLVIREKMSTAEDQNSMFSRLAGKSFDKTDEDHDMDDVFMTRAAKKQSDFKQEEKDRSAAVFEHRKVAASMEKCTRCMEKTSKHLIIAIGIKVYLCVPAHKSLAKGHCYIVPIQHVSAGTSVDEDVWTEIQVFRKGLTRMFQDQEEDVVFMETAMHLRNHPHMAIEVIPISNELGHMAPIYFKKAIQEAGEEWAQNKKLVDLAGKDVRKAIPKGFPYFSVDFGLQSGYAHVIEDEKTFPHWFGREIVGGMLEEDAPMWRKPHKENFDDQRKKVLEFSAMWKPYDWTQRLKKPDSDSDSDSN